MAARILGNLGHWWATTSDPPIGTSHQRSGEMLTFLPDFDELVGAAARSVLSQLCEARHGAVAEAVAKGKHPALSVGC